MTDGTKDIVKIILHSWGNQSADYLCFNEKNIKKLTNDINEYIREYILFDDYDFVNFNYINFILTLFDVCPHIFAHYNPTDSLINLNFTKEEENDLETLSNDKIVAVKSQISDIAYLIYCDNSECFKRDEKKLIKVKR